MGLKEEIKMDAEFGLSVEEIAKMRGVPVELLTLILKEGRPVLVSPSGVDYSFCPEKLRNDYGVRELKRISRDLNGGTSSWKFNARGLRLFNQVINGG